MKKLTCILLLFLCGAAYGEDIYTPAEDQWGYRYGPSILRAADGSISAWFAAPGSGGEWDWITYRNDNQEKVVLRPTPDSMDRYSVCDPGVIWFGGYYYLGYTSTIDSDGLNNNVYVARSRNPDGPYEKWDGSGWGGNPEPVIRYDEKNICWGAGEPSFVIVADTLHLYYSWICPEGSYTMVRTAPLTEDWPARLSRGAITYEREEGQDSCDVVYAEDAGIFLAFSTCDRFTTHSGIAVYTSIDGLTFSKTDEIREGIMPCCHNMGVAKGLDGHIRLADPILIGYAYGENWGKWSTRIQAIQKDSISFHSLSEADQTFAAGLGPCESPAEPITMDNTQTIQVIVREPVENPEVVSFTPVEEELTVCLGDQHRKQIRGKVVFEDGTWQETAGDHLGEKEITYKSADKSVCKVNKAGVITPIGPGTTTVRVKIKKGASFYVTVTVTDQMSQKGLSLLTHYRAVMKGDDISGNAST